MGAEVCDSGGVAGVGDGEGKGVFHPVMPDAVGVVGGGGEGVFLRGEETRKLEGDADGLARDHRSEGKFFEFGVRAVNFEADAGADHNTDDGLVDGGVKLDRDAECGDLAGLDNDGGLAVLAEGFESENFRAAVSAAEGGEEVPRDSLAPGSMARGEVVLIFGEDFAMIAAGLQPPFVDPPDFVGEGGDEVEFMGGEKDDGALAAEAFETEGGAGADEGVAGGKTVVERENRDGA